MGLDSKKFINNEDKKAINLAKNLSALMVSDKIYDAASIVQSQDVILSLEAARNLLVSYGKGVDEDLYTAVLALKEAYFAIEPTSKARNLISYALTLLELKNDVIKDLILDWISIDSVKNLSTEKQFDIFKEVINRKVIEEQKNKEYVETDDESFDELVLNTDKLSVVYCLSTSYGGTIGENYIPYFNKFAIETRKQYGDKIRFFLLSEGVNPKVCEKYDITHFPRLAFFGNGDKIWDCEQTTFDRKISQMMDVDNYI